jgi:O-antigen/teichoic acid export membrane protein
LFPTITSIQDDRDRASQLFLRLVQVVSMVGFPLVALQWVLAPLYLGSIYGHKWLPCVTAFRLIALYGIGRAVCQPALSMISAMGRPDVNLKISAATCPILVTAVYLGSRTGSFNNVALATAIAHGTFVWFYVIIPFRILGWDIKRFFAALYPAFVCSGLTSVLTGMAYRAIGWPKVSLASLIWLATLFAACYAGLMFSLFRGTALSTCRLVMESLKEARA